MNKYFGSFNNMTIRTRKLFGTIFLLLFLTAYCVTAVTVYAEQIATAPVWAQVVYYLCAGFLWIIPARYLIQWMQRPDK